MAQIRLIRPSASDGFQSGIEGWRSGKSPLVVDLTVVSGSQGLAPALRKPLPDATNNP